MKKTKSPNNDLIRMNYFCMKLYYSGIQAACAFIPTLNHNHNHNHNHNYNHNYNAFTTTAYSYYIIIRTYYIYVHN